MKSDFNGPREAVISKSSREGWVRVSTPYDEKLVLDLKNYIEPGSRKWDPDTKYWEVKDSVLGTLITILKKHFGENVVQTLTQEEKRVNANPFIELFSILKKMPNANLEKVYNSLALALHPDKGGSTAQMSALNQAFDEVRKK